MNGLIRASLRNPIAVTVLTLTLIVLGGLASPAIPIDILPVFKSPAVQVLTFYGGMPAASIEKDITNRMERWAGQATGGRRQESRSIVGASIVRNYFRGDVDPNGALTQVNSLAGWAYPDLPPGTLPPVVLPFDPTSTTPVCLRRARQRRRSDESVLYDVGRYEVRQHDHGAAGAPSPRSSTAARSAPSWPTSTAQKLQARQPLAARRDEGARRLQRLPARPATPSSATPTTPSTRTRCSTSIARWATSRSAPSTATPPTSATWPRPRTPPSSRPTSSGSTASAQVYIPVFRQLGASTLQVVDTLQGHRSRR